MPVTLYPGFPEHILCLPNGELNESSFCKLAGYHEIICAAAEAELLRHGESVTNTAGRGYAWALTSITLDVERPVSGTDELSCQTWISQTQAPYSRREMSVADREGIRHFAASMFFVPLDFETHHIRRDIPLYDTERFDAGDILIPDAVHKHSEPREYALSDRRTVHPSDIDALGHMNNCRYGAMVYDAFDRQERGLFREPFRYIIDFRRQMCEGDRVTIEKSVLDGAVFVRGLLENGRVSFSARVSAL